MGKKKSIVRVLRKSAKIPRYLWWKSGLKKIFNRRIRKRIPFDYQAVVSDWGMEGAGLPHFSSRLYCEVKLLQKTMSSGKTNKFEKSLEIGCGYGRLTPWIMEYSKEHFAVEPETELFKVAKSLYPNAHFFNTKAQKLPFPDEFFDLCVTWTVLQHIPLEEQEKAAKEITRVAKKTATIILAEEIGTLKGETVWFRTLESWAKLFEPWELVWQIDRTLEKTAGKKQGKIMRFERK
jgi:SAM-dependent methyltransferase